MSCHCCWRTALYETTLTYPVLIMSVRAKPGDTVQLCAPCAQNLNSLDYNNRRWLR